MTQPTHAQKITAKAMAEFYNGGQFDSPLYYTDEQREFWYKFADVALTAARKPTQQQIETARQLLKDTCFCDQVCKLEPCICIEKIAALAAEHRCKIYE